jgi:shikimate dehydrogenase
MTTPNGLSGGQARTSAVTESTPRAEGSILTPSQGRGSVVLGLIGEGISASLTPRLHEREAAANGLTCAYKIIDLAKLRLTADDLPDLLLAAERMGFAGLNITHPCKQRVVPLLDDLSDDAEALSSVNTVLFRNGRRIGHNTDMFGFAENLRRFLPGAPLCHVVQIGAGGAGVAVAHAVMQAGAKRLSIIDVDPQRSDSLARSLSARFQPAEAVAAVDVRKAVEAADGVINATPIGMNGHPGTPVPAELLRSDLWVADIVYFPLETELLRTARLAGCRTLNGAGMTVFQAFEAFRLFTGIEPDPSRMLEHFRELIG